MLSTTATHTREYNHSNINTFHCNSIANVVAFVPPIRAGAKENVGAAHAAAIHLAFYCCMYRENTRILLTLTPIHTYNSVDVRMT